MLDLIYPISPNENGVWKEIHKEIPKVRSGIFKVKIEDTKEIYAYFCGDRSHYLCELIGLEPTHWWSKDEKQPLYNVTHWFDNLDLES